MPVGDELELAGPRLKLDDWLLEVAEVERLAIRAPGVEVLERLLESDEVLVAYRRGDVDAVGQLAGAVDYAGERAEIVTKLTLRAWSAPKSSYGSNTEEARPATILPSASCPGTVLPEVREQPLDGLARGRQQGFAELLVCALVDGHQREVTVDSVSAAVVELIRRDADFASLVARQLRDEAATFAMTIDELIANDEDAAVEFKSTARWDIVKGERSPAMEDAVVKTVAAFLNTEGGTLLIGVGPDRTAVGLELDYPHVKPPNGDGFVNWLTTHLVNAVGSPAVMRTRARIAGHQGVDLCRLDVGRSTRPVQAKTSKTPAAFFVRMNNSSRALAEAERDEYVAQHWDS